MNNSININSTDLLTQVYNESDIKLIKPLTLNQKFGLDGDYIETHIFDESDVLLDSNPNYKNYSFSLNSSITTGTESNIIYIEPEKDVISRGYNKGGVKILYNFLRNKIVNGELFIKEISPSRTELRLSSNTISNEELELGITTFNSEANTSLYYKDFLLNFGNNNLIIGVNVLLDKTTPQYSVLVKLYEPLLGFLNVKDTLTIVEQISTPVSYKITFKSEDSLDNTSYLKSPNFDINITDHTNSSTEYLSYDTLFTTNTSSSYQQLISLLDDKNIDINIDYTDFNNFVHYSSAKERLLNFQYKLQLIEQYSSQIYIINSITGSTSQSLAVSESVSSFSNKINNIIQKFDGYDYYLYYESSSQAWPKTNNTYPYTLYGANSSTGLTWLGNDLEGSTYYGGQILSASQYDNLNKDYILNTIPEYLRIDEQNAPYEAFLNMVGQYFDNIWIYIKSITDLYKAENNLNLGISKDLVAYALTSLGAKLYNNGFEDGLFNNLISNQFSSSVVSASIVSASTSIPYNDINKEVYKRLYHNLPLLYKAKGTERGLRALISCYGIPDTILNIDEFGQDARPLTQNYNRFSQAVELNDDGAIDAPWGFSQFQAIKTSDNEVTNDAIEFRWKNNQPLSESFQVFPLLSVIEFDLSSSGIGVSIDYDSNTATGSYQNYAKTSIFILSSSDINIQYITTSSTVYLPVLNGDWWSFLLQRETGSLNIAVSSSNTYQLYIKNNSENKINFSGSINYFTTSSFENSIWNNTGSIGLFNFTRVNNTLATAISASYQELRYWSEPLSESVFEYHVLNPYSYEGNNYSSSLHNLSYRLSLGNALKYGSSSSHPAQLTSSFTTPLEANFDFAGGIIEYSPVTEIQYLNSSNVTSVMNDKISLVSASLVNSESLSPYVSIEKPNNIINSNVLEVVFSPQNEIDRDIIAQLGNFDLTDYLGDPQTQYSSQYDDLNSLRNWYFSKYLKNYQLFDYIRLIKFFDNSLFKMIKDYVPAKAELSTGILIKPHILERPKYQYSPIVTTDTSYTASIEVGEYSSDSGGIYDNFNLAYSQSVVTPLGLVTDNQTDNKEKYNGELNGSELVVSNQSLNDNIFLNNSPVLWYVYKVFGTLSNYEAYTPVSGEIAIYAPSTLYISRVGNFEKFKIHYTPINAGDSSMKYTLDNWLNFSTQNKISFNNDPTFIPLPFTISTDAYIVTNPASIELSIELGKKLTYEVYEFIFKSNFFVIPSGATLIYYDVFGSSFGDMPTIFEPYLPNVPFYDSGFDVDNNNALVNRKSSHFVDINSTTTQLTPTNFQSIISGTAKPAQTPDSNYSSLRHIMPRYEGSKNYEQVSSSIINDHCNFFAYFDSVTSSSPEVNGGGNIHVSKIINANGEIIASDENSLFYIEQMFIQNDKPVVYYISSSTTNNEIGTTNVYDSGVIFKTIMSSSGQIYPNGYTYHFQSGSDVGSVSFYSPFFQISLFTPSTLYVKTGSVSSLELGSAKVNWINYFMVNSLDITYTNTSISDYNYVPYVSGATIFQLEQLYADANLLPVKNLDFIKVSSASLSITRRVIDYVSSSFVMSTASSSFSLDSEGLSLGSGIPSLTYQDFNIHRRIPASYVVTQTLITNGTGLLIPSNYNPNLNYLELAKKAGLL